MTRKIWFWFALLFGLLVIAGAFRLRFDVEVLNLLPADLPVVNGLKLYQKNFTDSRELIITVKSPDAAVTEAAARHLGQALRKETNLISSVMWQPIWLERPAQAAELLAYMWLNQPPEVFGEFTNRLTGTNVSATLTETRERLATSFSPLDLAIGGNDPYGLTKLPESAAGGGAASFGEGQSLFASEDGKFRLFFVKAKPDLSNYRACIAWLKSTKEAVEAVRKRGEIPPEVSIAYTGGPAFVAEISGGMEHDMTSSVGITSVIIAILFWIFHRRIIPMLWLLVLLAVILASTLALGGLIFGAINVVSLGFAGILLGLAVDYGVVHYQEALASPTATIPEIRRAIGPSIFWAAVTTISAFLVLNYGGLPGLAQLGSLVALGVTLSALVMLFAFLPPLFRDRMRKRQEQVASGRPAAVHEDQPDLLSASRKRFIFGLTAIIILGSIGILSFGIPALDHTANALRPQHSPAYAALDEIKTHLIQDREPLWLIVEGNNEKEIADRLDAAKPILEQAVSNRTIGSFTLPTPLWPRTDYQTANRPIAAQLVAQREPLRMAALAQGFNTNSFVLTDNMLNTWQAATTQPGVFWPTNEMSQWIVDKVASRNKGQLLALGFIFPAGKNSINAAALTELSNKLSSQRFILSGWELLGSSILKRVQQNMWKVLLPMIALVMLSLWLAFRRPIEILLSLAVLAISGLCLLAVMHFAGWSWNLLNLMALPLMLGSGVDYSIFMQLALRRHNGNIKAAYHSVGRALLLCGGTAVAGFGSLSWSTNAGMASLGQVCAVGIAGNMLISVFLLPVWWRAVMGANTQATTARPSSSSGPSALYCSELWKAGLFLVRHLPSGACSKLSRFLASIYWHFVRNRREIVIQNLLPVLDGDRKAAEKTGRDLIRNFSLKVADLWRFESGMSVENLFGEWSGWEHFAAAQAQKRGILVITPHLGNWEFGGPLLTQRGINLQVITLAEPGNGFTQMRQASRARWDIDTLVIGEDPFAFVEIIRRLEAGATIALLIDRPPATSQVTVELFGRPFAASIAAAELARASGCVLLPVYLPLTDKGYAAHILPAVPYDRAALRKREARQQLTQEIARAFEPAIRQYPDQWYHFVPLWPKDHP
ncbi:MAG: putative rane protein [Pedosphaera sp.]|nr:putative rane protein [Pedosphaera sp.]